MVGDAQCLGEPTEPDGWFTGDPDCYLRALRDRQPGFLLLYVCTTPPGDGHLDYIWILGDETAVRERRYYDMPDPLTLDAVTEPPTRMPLPDASFFDRCIGSDDRELVLECLTAWGDPLECVPGACCPYANSRLPEC